MYAFAYVLAAIAVGAILLKMLDHFNHLSKTRECHMCRSRIDKRAQVCAHCGARVGVRTF